MAAPKKETDNLSGSFLTELLNVNQSGILPVVDFAEQLLFNGEAPLYIGQKAILKSFYNEPLTLEEQAVLEYWAMEQAPDGPGRTTWVPGRYYNNLVIEAGRRGSKCQKYDTLILTEHGILRTDELVDFGTEGWQKVEPFTVATPKGRRATATEVYNKGLSKTLRVTTKMGLDIEATSEHRLKVLADDGHIVWKYMSDLKIGDYLCIDHGNELWATQEISLEEYQTESNSIPKTLDENLAYVLGRFCMSLNTTDKHNPRIPVDPFDLEELRSYIDRYGELKVYPNADHNVLLKPFEWGTHRLLYVTVENPELWAVLRELAGGRCDHESRILPAVIRVAPRHIVTAFLKGLYDTEGGVSGGYRQPIIHARNRRFLHELQVLLLNMGIITVLIKGVRKSKELWSLKSPGQRVAVVFEREIGFRVKAKKALLEESTHNPRSTGSWTTLIYNQRPILHRMREEVRPLHQEYRRLKLGCSNPGRMFDKTWGDVFRENAISDATPYKIKAYKAAIKAGVLPSPDEKYIKHFTDLAELNYTYSPIVSIEESEALVGDLHVPDGNMYTANGFTNHNSVLAAVITLYEFYGLLSLANPARHYGLLPSDPIGIFVIAQSAEQVRDTLFAKILGYASESFYFTSLAERGIIEMLTTEIRCRKKNIAVYAKHTNSPSLVGYSLKLLVVDEAARFETNELGKNMADEIYGNVGRATSTFGKDGRRLMISSAWKDGDAIQRYYGVAERDPSTLGFRLNTWHLNVNKNIARDTPIIQSDYIAEPDKARLEYEGIRTKNKGTLFNERYVAEACKVVSAIDATLDDLDVDVDGDVRRYVGIHILRLTETQGPSFGHLDYGLKRDCAALACARAELQGDWKIIVDIMLQWRPRMCEQGQRVVSFTNVEETLLLISRARNIQKLTFDQWNSESSIQRLHQQGVMTECLSSSRERQLTYYSRLRSLLEEGRVLFSRDSVWRPDLEAELTGLVLLPNNKIIHPSAPKDLADAVCLAVWNCYQWLVKTGRMQSPAPVFSSKGTAGKAAIPSNKSPSRVNVNKLKNFRKQGVI